MPYKADTTQDVMKRVYNAVLDALTVTGTTAVTATPLASAVAYGRKTIAATATAEQVLADSAATIGVLLTADLSNTIDIYVGFSNAVTATSYAFRLQPGDRTLILPVANANIVYVYAVFVGGDTKNYTYSVF